MWCVSEKVRRGTTLHVTSIRNEAAYYCCIAQVVEYLQSGVRGLPSPGQDHVFLPGSDPLPRLVPRGTENPIYVCGDSHSISPSWHTVSVRGEPRLLIPALVTGLKACTSPRAGGLFGLLCSRHLFPCRPVWDWGAGTRPRHMATLGAAACVDG
jgi:hypothetical protein